MAVLKHSNWTYRLALWLPWGLYLLHSAFYADWLIDYAGISLTYARHLAEGEGLVPQPGSEPVEAYANPLWVLLHVPFFALKVFHLYATPKILAALAVLGAFVHLRYVLRTFHWVSPALVALTLSLLALNPYWVAWVNCGLENALYAWLIIWQVRVMISFERAGQAKAWQLFGAGLLAGALVMTRPDGLLLAALPPLALIFWKQRFNLKIDYLALWGLGWTLSSGAYFAIRRSIFHSGWPTAFVAQPPMSLGDLINLPKWHLLFQSVAGPLGGGLALLLLILLLRRGLGFQAEPRRVVWSLHLGVAMVIFLLMPPEPQSYRYATPFLLLMYPLLVLLGRHWVRSLPERYAHLRPAKVLVGVAVVGTTVLALWQEGYHNRIQPYDFHLVEREYVRPLAAVAALSADHRPTVVLPTVGAALWEDAFEVQDYHGLLDTTLALALARGDTLAYRQHLLHEVQPDFIVFPQGWHQATGLDQDSVFRQQYLPSDWYPQSSPGGLPPVETFYRRVHSFPSDF